MDEANNNQMKAINQELGKQSVKFKIPVYLVNSASVV